jgi:hypothetical protein
MRPAPGLATLGRSHQTNQDTSFGRIAGMTRSIWRSALPALLAFGLAMGCGESAWPQPEVKLDPALTNKPFPKVPDRPKQ